MLYAALNADRYRLAGAALALALAAALMPSCSSRQPKTLEEVRAEKKAAGEKTGNDAKENAAQRPAAPLDRPISFSVDYESLGSVIRSLTVLADVDVTIHPEVMSPEEIDAKTVSMDVTNMRFRDVMDWLVREIGACWQEKDDGSVWVTVDYYALDKPVTGSEFVPQLFMEKEAVDLIALLNSSIYPVTLVRNDIMFTPRADKNLLVIQAPQTALERIREVIGVLASSDPLPNQGPADESYRDVLEKEIVCNFNLISLSEMSRKMRELTGLNIGYRTDLVQKGFVKNKIYMNLDAMPVTEALNEITARFEFDHWELEKGRGVWLYGEVEPPYPPSAEVPWRGTVVRSYPIGDLALKRNPDELVRTIRNVCGRSSPGTLVEYSVATGKLLVIEEPAVIEKVEEYLRIAAMAAKVHYQP